MMEPGKKVSVPLWLVTFLVVTTVLAIVMLIAVVILTTPYIVPETQHKHMPTFPTSTRTPTPMTYEDLIFRLTTLPRGTARQIFGPTRPITTTPTITATIVITDP